MNRLHHVPPSEELVMWPLQFHYTCLQNGLHYYRLSKEMGYPYLIDIDNLFYTLYVPVKLNVAIHMKRTISYASKANDNSNNAVIESRIWRKEAY